MRSFAVALLSVLVVALVVGCGSSDEAALPPTTVTEAPSADSTRKAAPPLSGMNLDGDAIALGDFRGRPVLINVWSSW